LRALVVVALAGCPKSSEPVDGAFGTIVVDGKQTAPTRCSPGYIGRDVYLELATPLGQLRFKDKSLVWNDELLDCKTLDPDWAGGHRDNGTAYLRGTLAFDCATRDPAPAIQTDYEVHHLRGELRIDCGQITPEERASLDRNRGK
jgi:hypothetical protein